MDELRRRIMDAKAQRNWARQKKSNEKRQDRERRNEAELRRMLRSIEDEIDDIEESRSMAITVDWATKIISVPKADMILIQSSPTEIRQLDLNEFRLILKDLEDDEGITHLDTHSHNPPVTVGGAILARVVEIINGYTVTFEDGQYAVNLVGANSNVGDVVNVNQVSVRSSNSAGLQDLTSLQAASFNGRVSLDITSQYTGDIFPVGTREFPVNNVADAISIAEDRGLRDINILSDMTMGSGDWSDGYAFHGDSTVTLTLALAAGANITNCTFHTMTIGGVFDGMNTIRNCVVEDLTFFNGSIFESAIDGTIELGGGVEAALFDCWSNVAGGVPGDGHYPTIDMGGSGQSLIIRNYSGGIGIINGTGNADSSSLDMNSGRVIVDATCTDGTYTVRGVADVVDNSTGSATVYDLTLNGSVDLVEKILRNKTITNPNTGVMTVYDDDGVTVLFAAQIYEDASGSTPYSGNSGVERRERLA